MPSDPIEHDIIERFSKITVWKRGGERAPHKPLLILYALARLQRGEPRLAPFEELEEPLRQLLMDYGPPRKSFHPEYPFWHLQSDGLWEIPQVDELRADLERRSRHNNPPRSALLRVGAEGGLPRALYDQLRRRPDLVNEIAQRLLDDNWEPSVHEDILDAVGMLWIAAVAVRSRRSPAFRDTILRIYEHRCAVCGYDGMLGSAHLGIEAAHVRWHAAGGSDKEDNGLALCSFHHKALDLGAIGLDDDLHILVSQHIRGTQRVDEWLHRFSGLPLRPPQPGEPPPAAHNIRWHRTQVFRDPARGAG
jgi:putative restriction endonuclease